MGSVATPMLVLVSTQPMQFAAVCTKCGTREAPIIGSRKEAIEQLTRLSWRVDEGFTQTAVCAACAGPPSVFPAARIVGDPTSCSDCHAEVSRCSVCGGALAANDVLSCRRSFGHAHPRCATHRFRRFVPTR